MKNEVSPFDETRAQMLVFKSKQCPHCEVPKGKGLMHEPYCRERFRQDLRRDAAEALPCERCGAKPGKSCKYVTRDDRLGQPMSGLHVERYPLVECI